MGGAPKQERKHQTSKRSELTKVQIVFDHQPDTFSSGTAQQQSDWWDFFPQLFMIKVRPPVLWVSFVEWVILTFH